MKEIWANENSKSLDTYGKVVDQDGMPLQGVKVKAAVGLYIDFTHSGGKNYYTETDPQGRFSFVGIHGAGTGFDLEKPGYSYEFRQPSSSRPKDYSPDPGHPIIFTMWKQRGAEPIVFARISTSLPLDGTPVGFSLLRGKRVATGADMMVKYTRSVADASSGKPFDWSVSFEMPDGGGLITETDVYPNEAPAEGYQPAVTIDVPASMAHWSSSLERSFYFRSQAGGGQRYGRMSVTISLGGPAPTKAFIDAEVYTNPGGSRNLEYNPELRSQTR